MKYSCESCGHKNTVVKAPKKKRALSAYNIYVKEHYAEVKHMPAKERLGALAMRFKHLKD